MSEKIKPVPPMLELEDENTPQYSDIVICYDGAPVMTVLNSDSVSGCEMEEGTEDAIDAEARLTAEKVIRAYNSHDELLAVALEMFERHDAHARACNFKSCGCEDCKPFRAIVAKATEQP